MNPIATTVRTKLAAFALAALTSATVLGATFAGMQPTAATQAPVIALDTVTVTATRLN